MIPGSSNFFCPFVHLLANSLLNECIDPCVCVRCLFCIFFLHQYWKWIQFTVVVCPSPWNVEVQNIKMHWAMIPWPIFGVTLQKRPHSAAKKLVFRRDCLQATQSRCKSHTGLIYFQRFSFILILFYCWNHFTNYWSCLRCDVRVEACA